MSGPTDRPGLDPYSPAWIAASCRNVSEPLVPVVVDIAQAFFLDGRAPDSIAHLIEQGFSEALQCRHILSDGREVKPCGVLWDGGGWKWRGCADDGGTYYYTSSDISARIG